MTGSAAAGELGPTEFGWPAGLSPAVHEEPLAGGHIGRTTLAVLADGRRAVVKRCPYPASQEADGLQALAAAGAPVPAVLGVGPHVLVLEWVGGDPDWAGLGRAVAGLHRHVGDRFGWAQDNYAGAVTQDNRWCNDWPTFFARRVLGHLRHAEVPEPLRQRVERACDGPLQAVLRPDPPASLTHGDLWPGNMIDGRWLVDPAVSYADRELDLAYLSMSSAVPPEFGAAYEEAYPVDPGFPARRSALLLAKRLVNVRHFGDRCVPAVEGVLDEYGW